MPKRLPLRKALALQRARKERARKEIQSSESESECYSDSEYLPSSESEEEQEEEEEKGEEEDEKVGVVEEEKKIGLGATNLLVILGFDKYLSTAVGGEMVCNLHNLTILYTLFKSPLI